MAQNSAVLKAVGKTIQRAWVDAAPNAEVAA